jgi:hypothetical protein
MRPFEGDGEGVECGLPSVHPPGGTLASVRQKHDYSINGACYVLSCNDTRHSNLTPLQQTDLFVVAIGLVANAAEP